MSALQDGGRSIEARAWSSCRRTKRAVLPWLAFWRVALPKLHTDWQRAVV